MSIAPLKLKELRFTIENMASLRLKEKKQSLASVDVSGLL